MHDKMKFKEYRRGESNLTLALFWSLPSQKQMQSVFQECVSKYLTFTKASRNTRKYSCPSVYVGDWFQDLLRTLNLQTPRPYVPWVGDGTEPVPVLLHTLDHLRFLTIPSVAQELHRSSLDFIV